MRKVSRARSRQTTPWDSREEISPIQHFLQMHYKAHYEARHPQLTETGEVELINSFVPSNVPFAGRRILGNALIRPMASSVISVYPAKSLFYQRRTLFLMSIEYRLANGWNTV